MKPTRKKAGSRISRSKKSKKKPNIMEAKRPELLVMAKSFGIQGRHRMTRDELISAIELHTKKTPATEDPKRPVRLSGGPALPVPASHEIPKRQEYYDLPWSYGETELVLMPVDPYLIHAYWDFSPDDWKAIQNKREQVVLRIYDITMIQFNGTNAHNFFDVPISLEAQCWYVPIWSADKSFCADLGWRYSDGSFRPIIRSNVIQTPRAGISVFEETKWLEVRPGPLRQTNRKAAGHYLTRGFRLKKVNIQQDLPREGGSSFWDPLIEQAEGITKGESEALASRGIWLMNNNRNRA